MIDRGNPVSDKKQHCRRKINRQAEDGVDEGENLFADSGFHFILQVDWLFALILSSLVQTP